MINWITWEDVIIPAENPSPWIDPLGFLHFDKTPKHRSRNLKKTLNIAHEIFSKNYVNRLLMTPTHNDEKRKPASYFHSAVRSTH